MKPLLVLLLFTAPALAELRNDSPAKVMAYLESSGLTVKNDWRKVPDKGWMTSSRHRDVPNNLGVQYQGHEKRVTEATLWLNVFALPDEEHLDIFVVAVANLIMSASGTALTQPMRDAILSKKPWKETFNGYKISVDHVTHGKTGIGKNYVGFTLRFIVQSEAGGFPVDGPPAILTTRVKEG